MSDNPESNSSDSDAPESPPLSHPKPVRFPVLPLRDIVVFPRMIVPLFVAREKSIVALEKVIDVDGQILLLAQKDGAIDEPGVDDVFTVGILGRILQVARLPDGTVKILVEGGERVRVATFHDNNQIFEASVIPFRETEAEPSEIDALMRSVRTQFEGYVKLNKKIPQDILRTLPNIEDPAQLSDTIASHLSLKVPDKQALLEIASPSERLEQIYAFMEGEVDVMQVEKKIRSRVKSQMEKTQREYYLNEQLKAIQKELGDSEDGGKDELAELEEKIRKTRLTKEAREKAEAELKKMRHMSPMSAEATVVRNYLDWLLGIPWKKRSRVKQDITFAEQVLEEDHYGLEKVKERILEHLAVMQRTKQMAGPILCLVGPPGVGKTSLAKSIARATGRRFARMSLGGVRDEAEIRGHRRTYIGSMPGKLVQSMKKAGSVNPLFLLDEIDKIGQDFRGDPASALLEVLDPEQNHTFNDHYLEVEYDLSQVMFVTTANSLNLPQPLLDRMEIIRLSGYTEDEKIEIARRHLIDRQLSKHGLKEKEWSIDDDALRNLVRLYTREAGVRNLDRELAKLIRKATKELLQDTNGDITSISVQPDMLEKYVGVPRFRFGETEEEDLVGVVTGLAWTEVGGDILHIESAISPGKGKMLKTGKLGDVMRESIFAASTYVRARSVDYGIKPSLFDRRDIHVHVPEGATPKDGPSAGIAMVTSIVSVLTGIPVRRHVAMTGEVTLRGRVLPIGGLKEKLLAALRAGIKTVIIPQENEKNLADIPENVKSGLEIKPVKTVDEVLAIALVEQPDPIVWTEEDEVTELASSTQDTDESEAITTH